MTDVLSYMNEYGTLKSPEVTLRREWSRRIMEGMNQIGVYVHMEMSQ
jgi:hypothetical protein